MTLRPDLTALVARSVATARLTVTTRGAYAMTSADRYVRADGSMGAVAITLPPALQVVGELLRVVKVDATSTTVTIQTQGPDTIGSGALTTLSLTAPDQSVTLRAWRNGNTVGFDVICCDAVPAPALVDFWPDPASGDDALSFLDASAAAVFDDDALTFFDCSLSFF